MKSLRGLQYALESARSRHVPLNIYQRARVGFLRWSSRGTVKGQHEGSENSTPKSHHYTADERPVEPQKPLQHALSQPMRTIMRHLPHPVVVITTLENTVDISEVIDTSNRQLPPPVPRAMTVSSFTSLSIDPVPRVTFNVTLPSTTYQALVKCRQFNAHILASDDHGARIADLFTRGNRSPVDIGKGEPDLGVLEGLKKLGIEVLGQKEWLHEWEHAKYYAGKSLASRSAETFTTKIELPPSGTLPVLQGQGIMHVLKCEYRKLTPPVDSDFDHHAIVMGEVVDIVPGEHGIALAYADRAYRQMGEKLLDRPTDSPAAFSRENGQQAVGKPATNTNK